MFENFDRETIIFDRESITINPRFRLVYPPATIKILIVADGSIKFDAAPNGFTLRKVIEVLENENHQDFPSYARFDITTAHRSSSPNPAAPFADLEEFTFTSNSLNGFDQLWLFGINSGNLVPIAGEPGKSEYQSYLSAPELLTISDFMDSGGGVLAMGDHEDLGLGLCAGVPRVRNMRKWWFRNEIPAGQSKAPDSHDLTRNDTVQLIGGVDPGTSAGQRDVTPQPIKYKPYYKSYSSNPTYPGRFYQRYYSKYPHPVLCGPLGAITVFPDHAHEGDCVMPQNLNLNIDTSAGSKAEYPSNVKPEIIATGYNVVGRTKGGVTISNPRPFGLLGVYDGHDVADQNIGRVLVDATWHHWFDVNLLGIEDGSSQDDGSDDSANWRQIQAYFRNCAVWLSPKTKQQAMRVAGQLIVFQAYPIIKDYSSWKELARFKPSAGLYHHIGRYSLDVLERVTTKCASAVWLYEFVLMPEFENIFDRKLEIIERLKPRESIGADSKIGDEKQALENERSSLTAELFEDAIVTPLFGASMLAFWQRVEEIDQKLTSDNPEERLKMLQETFSQTARETVKESLPMMLEYARQRVELTEKRCSAANEAINNFGLG